MHLGISSYSYGWAVGVPGRMPDRPMTAFQLLERAGLFDVRVLQFGDNLPLHGIPESGLQALRREAEAARVAIEVGTRGITPDHLRTYLRIATRFGSPILRIVVDTATHQPDEEEIVRTLSKSLPEFEREGVTLSIENHDRFRAEQLATLIERIGSPALGVCLDTANSLGAQEGVQQVLRVLAPWVTNLHLKDVAVRRLSHLMGFLIEGRPAGEGDVDIPRVVDFVRTQVPRDVNAILELWPPPEDTIEATLTKEAAWVETSLRYLRGIVPA